MEKLIPVHSRIIAGKPTKTINARNLHEFLQVKSKYRDWIKNRIKLGFQQNQDFISGAKKLAASNNTQTDHYITLNMAKHLAMIERNEMGEKARQYFIDCEERLQQQLIEKAVQAALPAAVEPEPVKPELSPEMQKLLQERIALHVGNAHVQITELLTELAYSAEQRVDPLEHFDRCSGYGHCKLITQKQVGHLKASTEMLMFAMKDFSQKVDLYS